MIAQEVAYGYVSEANRQNKAPFPSNRGGGLLFVFVLFTLCAVYFVAGAAAGITWSSSTSKTKVE